MEKPEKHCRLTRDGAQCLKCLDAIGVPLTRAFREKYPRGSTIALTKERRAQFNNERDALSVRMKMLGHSCVELRDAVFQLGEIGKNENFDALPFEQRAEGHHIINMMRKIAVTDARSLDDLIRAVRTSQIIAELNPAFSSRIPEFGSLGRQLKLLAIEIISVGGAGGTRVDQTDQELRGTHTYLVDRARRTKSASALRIEKSIFLLN